MEGDTALNLALQLLWEQLLQMVFLDGTERLYPSITSTPVSCTRYASLDTAQGCTVSEAKVKETQKVSINACLCHFDSLSAEILPIKHNASQVSSCHTF